MCCGQDTATLGWQYLPAGQSPAPMVPRWQKYLTPTGDWRVLVLGQAAGSTPDDHLALPQGGVIWAGVFGEEMIQEAAGGLVVMGDLATTPPTVEELSTMRKPAPILPVPMGLNLARHMEWTPFGVEERVIPQGEAGPFTVWTAQAGKAPAGLYSSARWRLPRLQQRTAWQLELTLKGSGKIQAGISISRGSDFGDPIDMKRVELGAQAQTLSWTLGKEAAGQAGSLRLSLVSAPGDGLEVQIDRVVWSVVKPSKEDSRPDTSCELGVWDWSTRPEQWHRLRPLWKKAGISVAQLALPSSQGEVPPAFAQDLQVLRTDGFQVVAVEGDPHMILPSALEPTLVRHRRLSLWQGRYLDAVQYDVEPYLLPCFRLDSRQWHDGWLAMYQALAKAGSQVEAVVPFWLLSQPEGGAFLSKLAGKCERVVIMNYRSDPVEATAWATAWLEWSLQHRRPVALAIECGPIPDVPSATFRTAEKGRLWVAPWPGHGTIVALFDQDVVAQGKAIVLTQVRQGIVSGTRTTLRGQEPQVVADLLNGLKALARDMELPPELKPRLLLHEPSDAVLEHLAK